MRNCYDDVHKWLNVEKVELTGEQMLLVMWEMQQSDWEKLQVTISFLWIFKHLNMLFMFILCFYETLGLAVRMFGAILLALRRTAWTVCQELATQLEPRKVKWEWVKPFERLRCKLLKLRSPKWMKYSVRIANSLNLDCMYKKLCLEGEVSRDAGWRWGRCDGFKQAFKIHKSNSEELGNCTVRKHHWETSNHCLQEKVSSRCSSMIDAAHLFTLSTAHRAVSAGHNGIYSFIYSSFS